MKGDFLVDKNKRKFVFSEIIENIGLYVIGVLTFFISLFLFVVSMLHTVAIEIVREGEGSDNVVNTIREMLESVIYYNDNFVFNIAFLILSLLICFIVLARIRKIKLPFKILFLFFWTVALSTVWVISSQVAPTEDSGMVSGAALAAAEDKFDFLNDRYFKNYSFQLGYVFFNEIIIRIHNHFTPFKSFVFIQVINAVFLGIINIFSVMITDRLFKDERITNLCVFLLSLSIVPIISCVFVYGILPGMAFAIVAVYCEIRYILDNKKILGIVSALCICIAMMIKSNYLIWLIAMCGILFVMTWKRKKYIWDIVILILMVVPSMMIQPTIKSMYEKRSGVELGDSIPYASWIAMGLNETDLAPGWYNYFHTLTNFEISEFNASVASERSVEEIKNRIKYFKENPQYMNDFFYKKTVSQWNETSYESIWNNTVRGQYKEKGNISDWVCYKKPKQVKKYIDIFAQLVFCGFFFGCIFMMKKKNFCLVPFPLIFLGGFLYQMISEGKSQYIVPYFIIMTAFSAVGITYLSDIFRKNFGDRMICGIIYGKNNDIQQENSEKISEETVPEQMNSVEDSVMQEITDSQQTNSQEDNNNVR